MNTILNQNTLIEKAHNKALLNVLIVPLIIALATMNILLIVGYWGFIYTLYRFVFPYKQLNKLYFVKYLKVTSLTLFLVSVFGCLIIIL